MAQTQNTAERRADDAISQTLLCRLHPRLCRVAGSNHGIELALGDQLPALQILQTRDLRAEIVQIGLRFGQFGFDRPGIQLDQNLSFGDPLTAGKGCRRPGRSALPPRRTADGRLNGAAESSFVSV